MRANYQQTYSLLMLKTAVIGVGYLGRFHAQKYQLLANTELLAVCDAHQETCQAVAQELGVSPVFDYQELLTKVDAVSIAASTNKHYEIAKAFLAAGVHVLIEKPITETIEEADELIALAKAKNLKLQVGHLERFNAARLAVEQYLDRPLFIESNRLATFKLRGTEVNVILDLMIHDLDLIQTMVKSPIVDIKAHGAPILSSSIDIANARISFANHCIANITASRVSFKAERKTRIFQADSYISIDYQEPQLAFFKKGQGEMFPGVPDIMKQQVEITKVDALLEEIKAFVLAIEQDKTPLVSGEDGRAALAVAAEITKQINSNLVLHHDVS